MNLKLQRADKPTTGIDKHISMGIVVYAYEDWGGAGFVQGATRGIRGEAEA
jgi:hypothetical protein